MRNSKKHIGWLCLAVSLCLSAGPARAIEDADNSQTLGELETRYFQHTYPADVQEKRVARIERFVFGSEMTGDIDGRVCELMKVAARADASAPVDNPNSSDSGSPASTQNTPPQTTYTDTDSSDPAEQQSSYPRVTELEQDFLGKTYEKDLLPARVARLEVKKFGKVGTGDICDRLDKLSALAPPKPVPSSQDYDTDTTYSAPSSNNPDSVANGGSSAAENGGYPRVTQLEKTALGQAYEQDPLQARIARLETKEFGKVSASDDLADRIDRLEKKIRPANPVAQAGADAGNEDGSGNGNGGGRRGGGFGKALAMIGGALGGGMMGMGPGGMMMPGMMMPGMMGMGMGRGGMGMGVMPGRGYQTAQQQPSAPAAPVIQNPFTPDAPPVDGLENRTAAMEKFVLGKEFSKEQMELRVERLEKKLVPYEHNNANQDLTKRVNHLWSMLAAANTKKDVAARP